MGRPPSTGGPSFRFNSTEVAEMESILQAHNAAMPAREVLEALAQKFSVSAERSGKFVVQMKQVWHWFQNRRYALRAKAAKAPGNLNVSALPRDDSVIATNVPQAPQPIPAPPVTVRNVPQAPQHLPAPAVQGAGRNGADSNSMEFEAKSARDGAWYDVAAFLSHRKLETGDSEVLVRFAGFGAEEDEWVNVSKLVRQRSLPCESSECVAVLQGDLILCFQEGKEQALYFDAHVLDAQRRRHDMRGCRCRFLVRYDHDQSEEIVPLRKVCRRPETDYRLQQLHALNESATNQPKAGADPRTANTLRVYPPAEATKKQHKLEEHADVAIVVPAASHTNLPAVTEIKVQQPKVTEIVNAGTFGNSNVQPGNIVMQPKVEIMDAGTLEILNVSPSNVVQQPEVMEIAKTSTLGSSNVPQRNVVQQHEVMEIVNDGNQGNSNLLQGSVVQQQEVTEIVNDGNQGDSNVPPGNTIQQPKVTDIVNADFLGNSHVPPGNVIQQPEATEIVSSAGILGNANAPPGNVV